MKSTISIVVLAMAFASISAHELRGGSDVSLHVLSSIASAPLFL